MGCLPTSHHSPRSRSSGISGGRMQKLRLTGRTGAFAVRHRLPCFSPASPCGPLTVELFTAEGLPFGPRGCHPRSVCLATAELPALAHVERTAGVACRLARTPWVDSTARPGLACAVDDHHGGRSLHTSRSSCSASSTRTLDAASPTSSSTAARDCTARSVSVVPPPMRGFTMR